MPEHKAKSPDLRIPQSQTPHRILHTRVLRYITSLWSLKKLLFSRGIIQNLHVKRILRQPREKGGNDPNFRARGFMNTLKELIDKCNASGMFETVDYNKFNDLLMIHSSSVMEGSTLTFHDTEMLITQNITPEGKPLEHSLMTSDHYAALLKVNELAKDAKLKFSHALIKEIAAAVMRRTGDKVNTPLGTYDKALGEYRLNNVRSTGGHYYINYDKVQVRMNSLIQTVNETLTKVQSPDDVFALASYTHLEFLTIHPLGDGNGRTARLLNNLILLNKKMPTLVVDAAKKGKYIEAIKASREHETIDAFNDFLKAEYIEYWEKELSVYQKKDSGGNRGFVFTLL